MTDRTPPRTDRWTALFGTAQQQDDLSAPAEPWNLLRHDGRLWLVTGATVVDLGPAASARAELARYLDTHGDQPELPFAKYVWAA